MTHYQIDVSEVPPTALQVLRVAIAHARQNREAKDHVLPRDDFFRKAGLPDEVNPVEFMGVLTDVAKVAVFSVNYDEETLRGWRVFDCLAMTKTSIEFAVFDLALDAVEFT